MKFIIAVFALLVAVAAASHHHKHLFAADESLSIEGLHYQESQVQDLFKSWKVEHGKSYESIQEHFTRFGIFWNNLEKIYAHNQDKTQSFTKAMNRFGDLTGDEFKKTYANLDMSKKPLTFKPLDTSNVKIATSIDWRTKGAVTPIKDQGQCGSCWAFSSAAGLEGANFVAGNPLLSLSEQNLMDCSWAEGNQGCGGGLMDQAFTYVESAGICSEADYPYTGESSNTCNQCTAAVHIKYYADVPQANQTAFDAAINIQPVSIAIEADQDAFQFYSSGIITGACGVALDHGVTAVAYDATSYTIKNSWGTSWGEAGYVRLGRGSKYNSGQGQCGMLLAASVPQALPAEVQRL